MVSFIVISIPSMLMFGIRHALDVDHITAIDNLVRLYDTKKRSRWVGTGFSIGHMISVLIEMLLIIFIIGSATSSKVDELALWGGVIGAAALATIGSINICSMKKWGKTGSAILASKVSIKTKLLGPFGSSMITGVIFGLGFDTATQISALSLSAVASATLGIQVALILSGFFAIGMIPTDTLDSIVLRSALHRIFDKKGFRYMSYALSVSAMIVAAFASFGIITGSKILPGLTGPLLALVIISASFGYGFFMSKKRSMLLEDENDLSQIKNIKYDTDGTDYHFLNK